MRNTYVIFKRELAAYFSTLLAYVFIAIFLILSGYFTWFVGGFFEREQADLLPFFGFHPWLYLFLIPALSMRLWAEERKTGTIELLLTLPITMFEAVMGKFLAAWAFAGIALASTFPIWLTVNYLGDPDNGVILTSYVGSFLMAGAYLAIGAFVSALTRNQVIAFVLSAVLCLAFTIVGLIPGGIDLVSFLEHFNAISRGVIDLRDVVFFLSVMFCFLLANAIVVDLKKAD